MVDIVSIEIQTYDLSADEIRDLTSQAGATWPDELIEDYLTIIRNTLSILQGLQDFADQINENTENIALLTVRVEQNENDIAQLEITVVDLQNQITENFTYLHGSPTKSTDYDELQQYFKFDFVTQGDNEYICTLDTLNPAGPFDPLFWQRVSTVDNALLFQEHIDQSVEPDPHPQYQLKQESIAMYGGADNVTLNTTPSKLINYPSSINYAGGDASSIDTANGELEITVTGTYKLIAYVQGSQGGAAVDETIELLLDNDATQTVIDSYDVSNVNSTERTLKCEIVLDFSANDTLSLYLVASAAMGTFTISNTTFEVKQIA